MATRARPVTGLMPTEFGVSCRAGRTKLTACAFKSTTAIVFDTEFTTSAILRTESTETPVGPEGWQPLVATPVLAVHRLVIRVGGVVLRSIRLMSFDPWFATTAMPVAGLMETSAGAEVPATDPTATRVVDGGVYVGWTARLVTANLVGSVALLIATG